ncbi:aminoglycoside phosphotransferase family protein [Luteimicrobium sp. NPDC057192]|uniref:aminoglycoside phosphotransferase family protein n=1 Tax=Luteimicrobium sp. NPDC057192 TaxID=3346042 RepID=UPI00363A541A
MSVLTVPESFRAMPRWWHDDAGRTWLDALPALVDARCETWGLVVDGEPWHGSNALVVPVRRGGEPLALRLAPPGDDVAQEVRALGLWAGRGTVRLVDADLEARATLLERLDGSRTLEGEPLAVALPVLGALMRTLAVPVPDDVPSTSAVAAGLRDSLEDDWRAVGQPTPRWQLDHVLAGAAERAGASAGDRAVNGDLHFGQVLAGERAPWLVVDPVLLRGDREYDLGRVLWSRLDELPSDDEVSRAFRTVVDAAEVPADRAASWVVLRAMSYLVWGLERGLTIDPSRCRRLLDLFCA